MNTNDKLSALRAAMQAQGLYGTIQPVHDEYMSEYPPACARRVEWLSGFSGSAGMLAVLQDKAALFVDGRYTLQAKNEVDTALFEIHNSGETTPEKWLADHKGKIGYDPKLFTGAMVKRMQKLALQPVANLVDTIWKDQPPPPATPLFIHEEKYSGEAHASKRKRVAEVIKKAGADVALITAPDAICWLLNVRAHDVESAPLALASAMIGADGSVELFIAPSRCDAKVREHLGNTVAIAGPETLKSALARLKGRRVLVDPASAPVWFMQKLDGATLIEGQDPCLLPKATKNEVELQGMREAHVRDGAAVAKLLYWLDGETKKRSVTEMEVVETLLGFRAASPMFKEASFSTIAGSGPNGAIVHYRATQKTNRTLKAGELFLLDSGGQYPDGTTDITRTMVIGEPGAEHKDRFTRVLKGHIAIATARFPEGTSGSQLDALARQYLWQAGLDYDHGTGHGVGCFLNVHEGPQRISKRGGDAPLAPGMIVSNEPGYYKTGEYGIRIENLVAVVKDTAGEGGKSYFKFTTITCAPIDIRLVDGAMLSPAEKGWLNEYHAGVKKQLSPLLFEPERKWLAAACASL